MRKLKIWTLYFFAWIIHGEVLHRAGLRITDIDWWIGTLSVCGAILFNPGLWARIEEKREDKRGNEEGTE